MRSLQSGKYYHVICSCAKEFTHERLSNIKTRIPRDSFNNKEKENEPWRNFYLLPSL